ncbi:unnamed protein product [Closterium sp. NIES-53]
MVSEHLRSWPVGPTNCFRCRSAEGASSNGSAEGGAGNGGATIADTSLSFMFDSDVSQCFFHDCTTLSMLSTTVTISLADPSSRSVVTRNTTALTCPAVPIASLICLQIPSFSYNLVGVLLLQDLGGTTTFPGHERSRTCTVATTGAPLATFPGDPTSCLFTLHNASPPVAALVK